MTNIVQLFLSLQVVIFGLAALMHAGVLMPGYEHREAMIAETVIGLVLFAGLVITVAAPSHTRRAALLAQAFGLVGTLVGLFMIIIGIGPQTAVDIAIHATMLALLLGGIVLAARRHVRVA
jgi:hypothetical protein